MVPIQTRYRHFLKQNSFNHNTVRSVISWRLICTFVRYHVQLVRFVKNITEKFDFLSVNVLLISFNHFHTPSQPSAYCFNWVSECCICILVVFVLYFIALPWFIYFSKNHVFGNLNLEFSKSIKTKPHIHTAEIL